MALMNRGYNDPDYAFENSFRPKQKVPVAPAPVAAPAPPPPPAFTYKPPSLGGYDEYMAQQHAAFNPVAIGGGGGYMHDSYETPYTLYSDFDTGAAHKTYMDTLYSEMGVSPEMSSIFDRIYGYQGARESLAKNIGFTGRTGVTGGIGDSGINEGGGPINTALPETLSPEYAQALAGYSYKPTIQGNDPAITVYKPSGEEVGQFRVGDSPGRMMKFMSMAIPALVTGGFGIAAAPLLLGTGAGAAATAATSGAIGSGLNTAIQGGNLEDVLKSAALSGATAGASNYINTGLTSLPWMKEGIDYARGTIQDILQGAPEFLIDTVSGLPRNVVQGAARGLIKGDITGGITDAVLGQIVQDVAPTLKLTEPQARILATYLRDGNEGNLVLSLGSNLAKQAISAANAAAPMALQGTSPTPTTPAWDEDFTSGGYSSDINYGIEGADLPSPGQIPIVGDRPSVEDLLAANIGGGYGGNPPPTSPGQPSPGTINIYGQRPSVEDDLAAIIGGGYGGNPPPTSPGQPSPGTINIRGDRPSIEDLLAANIGGGYGGNPPPTSPGQPSPGTIIITGQKPVVADELNLPPYNYTIPELAPLEPPKIEVEKPTAPPLSGGPTTPTTPSKGIDINSLLNLLGGGGQEPVLSQVLAQMPGFDVEKELSPTLYAQRQAERKGKMSPQEQQMAVLLEELNRG